MIVLRDIAYLAAITRDKITMKVYKTGQHEITDTFFSTGVSIFSFFNFYIEGDFM